MNIMRSIIVASLAFTLITCGGGGGGGSNSVPASPISKLYIAGGLQSEFYAYDAAQTANGTDLPDRTIAGANTLLTQNYGIDYDHRTDSIFIGNRVGANVPIFDNVAASNGNIAPDRLLSGSATNIIRAHDVAVDETRNLLYVSGNHGVTVYTNADTIDGNVAPVRHITGINTTISGRSELRMALDISNDRMYLADANRLPRAVLVFDNISTLDGDVAPNRVIAGANTNFDFPWGIAIDVGRDILYIGDQGLPDAVYIFANASTADGDIAPARTITGATSTIFGPSDTYVDEVSDTLYITDASGDQVLIWDNASTADGDLAPSRALTAGFIFPGGLIGVQ